MNYFVVRLNPDTRQGIPYSQYPSLTEYKKIHESSPMNGFHEAVNFLSEDGYVRGYLPPRHLKKIKSHEPFSLITVTAKTKTAKTFADLIIGIQVGCKYVGKRSRTGGSKISRSLDLFYHYTCQDSLSIAFDKPLNNASKLLLKNGKNWRQGPTFEINKKIFNDIVKKAKNEDCISSCRKKFDSAIQTLNKNITTNGTAIESTFDDDVENLIISGQLPEPDGNTNPKQKEVISYQYERDPKVAAYILQKAKGICHDCHQPGPFISKKTNLPFLEVHHEKSLSNNGNDTTKNTVALCPNCHRKRHYGLKEKIFPDAVS